MSSDQQNYGQSPYDQGGYEQSQNWGADAQQPAASQPSASQPSASQPSATPPVSQTSAADAYGQQQQYAGSAYPAQQQYTPQQQGYYPPQQPVQPTGARQDANPLKALFDFTFTSYATPNLIKIVYIASIALGVLYWLGMTVTLFAAGANSYGGSAVPGVLTLLFGWIPLLFWIAMMRLTLEFYLANVRTAADVRTILDKVDQP